MFYEDMVETMLYHVQIVSVHLIGRGVESASAQIPCD